MLHSLAANHSQIHSSAFYVQNIIIGDSAPGASAYHQQALPDLRIVFFQKMIQRLPHPPLTYRFQQIVGGTDLIALHRVIRSGGQKNNRRIPVIPAYPFCCVHPVHIFHVDVKYQQVILLFPALILLHQIFPAFKILYR